MMEIVFGALIVLMLLGVLGVVAVALVHRRRRRRLAAYAQHRGWHYQPKGNFLAGRWSSPPFDAGGDITDVFTGDFHGHQMLSCLHTHTVHTGQTMVSVQHHVIALHLPAPLPWLRLTPETPTTAVARFFGGQDIRLESKAFNDAWRVQGPEGQFPFDLLHPRMMERLLQHDAIGRNITVEGQDVFIHVQGEQKVEHLDFYLNLLLGIAQQVPRHVWLRVGHDPLAGR